VITRECAQLNVSFWDGIYGEISQEYVACCHPDSAWLDSHRTTQSKQGIGLGAAAPHIGEAVPSGELERVPVLSPPKK
jgi:hypothetical protein